MLLPAIPTTVVLAALQRIAGPPSLASLASLASLGLAIYAVCYLAIGASRAERRACSRAAVGALHLVARLAGVRS